MHYHYILVGWKGSATNAKLLYGALYDEHNPLQAPRGKYFLAEVGYANTVVQFEEELIDNRFTQFEKDDECSPLRKQ
ncbi:hypothetical protein EJ110_NYTH48332 [Nymphaea thermarum]|nr:hypothetical protein EJ110_NYTH48332 [Nymphaea thermarum]